jgi:hypothetical protein
VREKSGTVERFGLVELTGFRLVDLHQGYWELDEDAPHLRDIFPGSRRTIILG